MSNNKLPLQSDVGFETSGNVAAGNVLSDNYLYANGNPVPAYSNAAVSTYLASGTNTANIETTGNISGAFILGNISAATGLGNIASINLNGNAATELAGDGSWVARTVYSNANVSNYLASGTDTANILTSGNIVGGNVGAGGIVEALGNVIGANFNTAGVVSATGNVHGANFNTAGVVSATGNVDAANFNATGNVGAAAVNTPEVAGASVTIKSTGVAQNITLSATGNIVASGSVINNVGAPTQGTDAATKAYVDANASGLVVIGASQLATAAALPAYTYNNGTSGVGATLTATANGALTVDGVLVTLGDRILVKNETAGNEPYNGVYTVTDTGSAGAPYILTRATDDDQAADIPGAYTLVTGGNTNANTGWSQSTPAPIVVGTTNILWSQFSSQTSYTAGNAVAIAGTVISVVPDDDTTAVNGSNQIAVKAGANLVTPNIGAATFSTLTVTPGQTGDISVGNVSAVGDVTANYFVGNGSTLSGIVGANVNGAVALASTANLALVAQTVTGANVSGTVAFANSALYSNVANTALVASSVAGANVTGVVAQATQADTANIASVAYSVDLANVAGAGTIAAVDLNANASTVLAGDGTWITPAGTYNDANVSTYLASGTNTAGISTTGNVNATAFAGNGATLSDLTGSNVVGFVANATLASTANVASVAYSVAGANVNGFVANATLASTANVASEAYSVDLANVAGAGNIAAVNLNGNTATYLTGDGTWAGAVTPAAIANGNSEVSIATAGGPITLAANGNAIATFGDSTIAIGQYAGAVSQSPDSIAIGRGAGQDTQLGGIAIGVGAGYNIQGIDAIAIGHGAAAGDDAAFPPLPRNAQGNNAVAIGTAAAANYQGANSVAIGYRAGWERLGVNSIAIGGLAGNSDSADNSIVISASGVDVPATNSGFYVSPVRNDTGNTTNAIYYNTTTKEVTYGPVPAAYGDSNVSAYLSGGTNVDGFSTAGDIAANNIVATSGLSSLADGFYGGTVSVVGNVTADGNIAAAFLLGNISQATGLGNIVPTNLNANGSTFLAGNGSWQVPTQIVNGTTNLSLASSSSLTGTVAGTRSMVLDTDNNTVIGRGADYAVGKTGTVVIGSDAGSASGGYNGVAIGTQAGSGTQGDRSVAVGFAAGSSNQGDAAVAIGPTAGLTGQGRVAVAFGQDAGFSNQGDSGIAIGEAAGYSNQGANAIAIGTQTANNQGAGAISIGALATANLQAANSIALNATAVSITASNAGFYVAPVRNDTGNVTNAIYYNTTTKEVTYGPAGGGGGSYGDANVSAYLASGTNTDGYSTTGNVVASNVVIGNNKRLYSANNFINITTGLQGAQTFGGSFMNIDDGSGSGQVAIGAGAGAGTQTVSIGYYAGVLNPGAQTVSIGTNAGNFGPGSKAVAIGQWAGAGSFAGTKLGANSIALGAGAAAGGSAANVIVLNATGANFTPATSQTNSFYVNPVRNDTGNVTNVMYYNTTTKEVTYGPAATTYGNTQVAAYLASGNIATDITTTANVQGNVIGGTTFLAVGDGVYSVGVVSATGNVTGSYFIGNGSQLTGLPAGYTDANVSTYLASGNNTAGYTTTGNVFAGNVIVGNASSNVVFRASAANSLSVSSDGLNQINLTGSQAIIGFNSGINAGSNTVVLGGGAGSLGGGNTVSIGWESGTFSQGVNSIAIGYQAGQATLTGTKLGANAIAIGAQAALSGSANNVIILNATGANFTPATSQASSFYVNPVRNDTSNVANVMYYNAVTKEITYNAAPVAYTDANVSTYLASGNNTAGYTTTGNISANNFIANGTLTVTGTVGTGNISGANVISGITLLASNSVVAGATVPVLPNSAATFGANVNSYAQVTFQNLSNGADATTDVVLTASNGNDTTNFIDVGVIGSGYDNATPTNSLGNIVFAADGYVYAQGNVGNTLQPGGNLAIGTTVASKTVKIFAGGNTASNIVATFANTGVSVAGNITGNYILGNGAFLTGIAGGGTPSAIVNGTSNVTIAASAGNVLFNVNGNTAGVIGTSSVYLGYQSGQTTPGQNAVAVGLQAGQSTQGFSSIAIGYATASLNQGQYAAAIGALAGGLNQGNLAVAFGYNSGSAGQGANAIAIGQRSGYTSQGANAIAIGSYAGYLNQGANSIAIGANAIAANASINSITLNATNANITVANQGLYVDPVRNDTGNVTNVMYYNTTTKEVTYGPAGGGGGSYGDANVSAYLAGGTNTAGFSTTGNVTANAAVIGNGRLYSVNNFLSLATGLDVAATFGGGIISVNDGSGSGQVAIGAMAGAGTQTVAIGAYAGVLNPGAYTISIGPNAGNFGPGSRAIAIGQNAGAGSFAGTKLGGNAIAIGAGAASGGSAANVIVLNATGANFTPSTSQTNSFYVNPIRNDTGNITNSMYYNTTTKEVTYGPIPGSTLPKTTLSGNVTLQASQAGSFLYSTTSTAASVTIPSNANVAFAVGTTVTVVLQGTGSLELIPEAGVNVYLGGNATAGTRTVSPYGVATLLQVAPDTWFINGTGVY